MKTFVHVSGVSRRGHGGHAPPQLLVMFPQHQECNHALSLALVISHHYMFSNLFMLVRQSNPHHVFVMSLSGLDLFYPRRHCLGYKSVHRSTFKQVTRKHANVLHFIKRKINYLCAKLTNFIPKTNISGNLGISHRLSDYGMRSLTG